MPYFYVISIVTPDCYTRYVKRGCIFRRLGYTVQCILQGLKGDFNMAEMRTVSVNRWGNGLGIRLPKEFTDKEGITETSRVEVIATGKRLIITRAKEPRRHIPLAERIKGWDGQPYEITAEDDEWLNMEPAGEEV